MLPCLQPTPLSDFLYCWPNAPLLFPDPTNDLTCHQISSGFSWMWQFLRLSLLVKALTVFKGIGQAFCAMPLPWDSWCFSYHQVGVTVFEKEGHKSKVSHGPHLIWQAYITRMPSLRMITLTTFTPGAHCKVTSTHTSTCRGSWKEFAVHSLWFRSVVWHTECVPKYWEFFIGSSFLRHDFIYSMICLYRCNLMDIYFILWVVI